MEVVIEPADLADLEAGALVTVEITTPTHTQTMLPQSLEGEHEIGTKTVLAKTSQVEGKVNSLSM